MAIENALIAKIIAGVTVTGGVGTAGVVFRHEIANSLTSVKKLEAEANSYLITKLNAKTEANKPDELLTGNKKNYYCQTGGNRIDCEVSLVAFDATKKSVDLKTTVKDLTSPKEETAILKGVSEGSYFKIKLNKEDLSKFDFSSEQTIDLLSNSTWSNLVYSTLTAEFKVEKGVIKTNNKTILAAAIVKSATSGTTDEEFIKYKCTSEKITTPTSCTLKSFSTPITDAETSGVSTVDFSSNSLTNIDALNKIVDTNLLVVTLSGINSEEIGESLDFKPYEDNSSVTIGKKTYTLTVKAQLFGSLTTGTKGVFFK